MERRAPPPTWLNREFVEIALEKKGHKKVSVDTVDVKYASVPGSGYASLMYRATVSFREQSSEEVKKESIVVKVALSSGTLKELVDKFNAFTIESLFLHEVMPQIHETLASVEGEEFRPLTAECYHWGREPQEFLVLQDLLVAGFRLAEAGKPLDYHHCRLVMRAYGRLHAASVQILSKRPHYRDTFNANIFSAKETVDFFKEFGENIFHAVADELEKCPGYEKYSRKYRTMVEGFFTNTLTLLDKVKEKTKLPVLTHGDCWKNNFMFKYVDGHVSEVRLVDLQITNVNSAASDLQYFLYANASEEVHRNHLESLLEEYHSALQTTLRQLGLELEADAYPFEELQLDMNHNDPVGLLFSAFSGLVLTSEKYGAEFTEAMNDPKKFGTAAKKILQNPYTLSYIKYLCPIFERKGLFTTK